MINKKLKRILTYFITSACIATNTFAGIVPSYTVGGNNPDRESVFNIKGDKGQLSTSNGYLVAFRVENSKWTQHWFLNSSEKGYRNFHGLTLKVDYSKINENCAKITYTVTNNSTEPEEEKIFSIATRAAVEQHNSWNNTLSSNIRFSNGVMTRSDDWCCSTKYFLKDTYGVTDVDNYWFGGELTGFDRYNIDKLTTLQVDQNKYYKRGMIDGNTSNGELCYSWRHRTIKKGETQVFSVIIGVGKPNEIPTLTTNNLSNTYSKGGFVEVKGLVNDLDKDDKESVYYSIDDKEEILLCSNLTSNSNFIKDLILPKDITKGEHEIKLWVVDSEFNLSPTVSYKINIDDSDTEVPTINTIITKQ